MAATYLIVHDISMKYVRNVVTFIHRRLRAYFDSETVLLLLPTIDAAEYPDNSVVFLIGERFAPHRRRRGCRYVYLNFSITERMGNPLRASRSGFSAVRRKRQMLDDKIPLIDLLLDYFPPQTQKLRRRLKLPILEFHVGVDPSDLPECKALDEREYDICFVGTLSPRRTAVLDALAAAGFKLSPSSGVIFEEEATRSRLCLNIHAVRSNHLETPRIIGAMAAGTPLMTEPSFGLETLSPTKVVACAEPRHMARAAMDLLGDQARIADLHARSQTWYHDVHLPHIDQHWRTLCAELRAHLPR